MLHGNDPVAYFTDGKAVVRSPAIEADGYRTDAELDALYAQRKAAGTLNPLAQKYGD